MIYININKINIQNILIQLILYNVCYNQMQFYLVIYNLVKFSFYILLLDRMIWIYDKFNCINVIIWHFNR